MKIAYFAESSADEEAIKILTEGILGRKTESVTHHGLRHRGWPAVKRVFPSVLKAVHYDSDAEGFVMVVDSNGSMPHSPSHEPPNAPVIECRLCQLRGIADEVRKQVRRSQLRQLKIAFGVAMPAIEAWLLNRSDAHVTEAAWVSGFHTRNRPYITSLLKQRLYSTARPSLAIETAVMRKAASDIAANLSRLEQSFPCGFGVLCKSLRSW